jgi:hypothetical protein
MSRPEISQWAVLTGRNFGAPTKKRDALVLVSKRGIKIDDNHVGGARPSYLR